MQFKSNKYSEDRRILKRKKEALLFWSGSENYKREVLLLTNWAKESEIKLFDEGRKEQYFTKDLH
jgi:hypothetical protein